MTSEKVLFTTSATAHGGRDGRITTEDNHLQVDLSVPSEIGGPGGSGTNPEQLFAAGYAACFHSAMGLAARRMRVDITNSTVTGQVSLLPSGTGGFKLGVELAVAVPGVDHSTVEDIVEKAHQVCPYSHATRGNIDVKLTVVDA